MINIPCCQDDSFGITVRGNSAPNGWQGYVAGVENGSTPSAVIWADSLPLASGNFNPEHNWYTYRVEVKGNAIKFLIDGAPVLEATDNKYLTGTQIGLLCTLAMQINISSFKVIVL